MALTRAFSPAQFRDATLGTLGPAPVAATIPSTAAGANGEVSNLTMAGVQVGDVLFVLSYSNGTTWAAGVDIEAVATAANTIALVAHNGSGAAFNPGAQTYVVAGFRFKTA